MPSPSSILDRLQSTPDFPSQLGESGRNAAERDRHVGSTGDVCHGSLDLLRSTLEFRGQGVDRTVDLVARGGVRSTQAPQVLGEGLGRILRVGGRLLEVVLRER